MASMGNSVGDGGDGGREPGGRFDPGQGAADAGNAPLQPDPRHTPGCGYDPVTGAAATAFAPQPYAGLEYDPVTQTVAVDVTDSVVGAGGGLGLGKDAVPGAFPPGVGDHSKLGDLPHNAAPLGGETEGQGGGGGGGGRAQQRPGAEEKEGKAAE